MVWHYAGQPLPLTFNYANTIWSSELPTATAASSRNHGGDDGAGRSAAAHSKASHSAQPGPGGGAVSAGSAAGRLRDGIRATGSGGAPLS